MTSNEFETAFNAASGARILLKLKNEKFYPHIVLVHPGWGKALFDKDVFPSTKLNSFF